MVRIHPPPPSHVVAGRPTSQSTGRFRAGPTHLQVPQLAQRQQPCNATVASGAHVRQRRRTISLHDACFGSPQLMFRAFRENPSPWRPHSGCRVGVCAPSASFATLALNGSEKFDAFALRCRGLCPPWPERKALPGCRAQFGRSRARETTEIGAGQGVACSASDCLSSGEPASGRKSDLDEFDGSNPFLAIRVNGAFVARIHRFLWMPSCAGCIIRLPAES